ncbi:MAG TPA: SMC family ATPase [Gemmatimonadales bacterium]|nr:SMC family ATPase [Gemmatimonadales bacterium]
MQIHRLRLVNFRQHEDSELILGAGLTGIVGDNGAGKSTLLEAIAFAMYGTPAARGSKDSIRRRGAPPRSPVRVELDFALGAHEFRVTRSLSQAELFQDGDPAPIANSLGTVTEKLSHLLGMTRAEFFNTYFTGQKDLMVMARMTAPERAQFLSRVLGFEQLRVAQERLKETRTTLRAQLQALQAGLADPGELDAEEARVAGLTAAAAERDTRAQEAVRLAVSHLGELAPRWDTMQQLRTRVQSLEADIRVAEHQVTTSQERTRDLDRQIADALQAQAHLVALSEELAPLAALRAELEVLQQRYAASSHRAGLHARLEAARAALADLDQRIAALPTAAQLEEARGAAAAARAAAAVATEVAEDRHTAWVRDLQDAKTKRQSLLDQYEELQEQFERITKAGQDGACPTCSRPLGPDFEPVLAVLGRQLEEVKFNGTFYRKRLDQLVTEPADVKDAEQQRVQAKAAAEAAAAAVSELEAPLRGARALQEKRASLVANITELEQSLVAAEGTYDPERHKVVQAELKALEGKALEAERFRGLAERAARLAPELLAAEQAVSTREEVLKALLHQRQELGFSEPEFEEVRARMAAAEEERRRAELHVVEARGERAMADEAGRRAAERRAERATRQAEVQRLEQRFLVAQELDRALTDLRTDLNAQLRPDLSELASGFLRDLTDGRYTDLELDESYTPTLVDDGEAKPVISGGEEDIAFLALRLAISQMIAERAGQPLSLLVLDEIFGSLDEARRVAVMTLLRSLADRFPQVILITHIEAVREGFDRIIRVERDPGRRVAIVREDLVDAGGRHVAA